MTRKHAPRTTAKTGKRRRTSNAGRHNSKDSLVRSATSALFGSAEGNDRATVAQAVGQLISALPGGSTDRVLQALARLGITQGEHLHRQIERMTQNLHEAMRELRNSLDRSNLDMSSTNIPDAADKLESVIRMTSEAAHRTMDCADEQSALLRESSLFRAKVRQVVDRAGLSNSDIAIITRELEEEEARSVQLSKLCADITMAQSYQDLSGQALRKVVKLVTELERQLTALLSLIGSSEEQSSAAPSNGKGEPSVAQGEADQILKNLGI